MTEADIYEDESAHATLMGSTSVWIGQSKEMLHQDLGDNSATITVTISASKMSLITSMQKPPQHLAKSRGNEAASQRNEKTSGLVFNEKEADK
ncbi:hypothetical protein RRG08_009831 [Elysia crispata]|uniref:Uncharacterized protein n=1 Tax=Elysia crispata TaxID=231223 RepID=A0AAE0Z530_9GAST|nr:hypothetical protein RRG08_009831 [Elysia crispata]